MKLEDNFVDTGVKNRIVKYQIKMYIMWKKQNKKMKKNEKLIMVQMTNSSDFKCIAHWRKKKSVLFTHLK